MFCIKCGNKSMEGAAFCLKCGTPLMNKDALQQDAAKAVPTVMQKPPPKPQPRSPAPKKMMSKKILFGLVGVALVAVIAIAVALSVGNGGSQSDLFQIASGVSPMTEYGFDATYGNMFSWLMNNRRTNLNQQGDIIDLTFSGNTTGGDYQVSIVLRMTGVSSDFSNVRLIPYGMTLNGINVPDFNNPEGILMELFWAHHNRNDYRTFMDFVNWDNENAFGTFEIYFGNVEPTPNVNNVTSVSTDQGTTITKRNNSIAISNEIIGRWRVTYSSSSEWFVGGETVEFFADGSGVESLNGSVFHFSWLIRMEQWLDNTGSHMEDHLILRMFYDDFDIYFFPIYDDRNDSIIEDSTLYLSQGAGMPLVFVKE